MIASGENELMFVHGLPVVRVAYNFRPLLIRNTFYPKRRTKDRGIHN
jgi:hypothetical protein